MSGGHFNYRENQIGDAAIEIDELIAVNDSETLDQYGERIGNSYPPEVIEKFEEAVHTLQQAAEMVQRIDYLVSGDDGQDTFLRLWQTEVRKSWCYPTIPTRPPLGTRVEHATHGKGKIFSYEQCDDVSCGVDFGRKGGQWCIAIRELIIPPSTQALARSAAELPAAPCDCGNPDAYWEGHLEGRREYGCVKCHAYNAGLDTAYRLAQEVVGSTMEGETLLCGIVSSKKRLKADT